MCHPAACLPPDFWASADVVRQRVVGVGKLIKHAAFALLLHLHGQVSRTFDAFFLGYQHQVSTIRFHRLSALNRLVLRHDEHHAVAAHRRDHCECDAGVAGSGFDQRVAGLDRAAFFGFHDHRIRRAVFHAARGIVAFELAENDRAIGHAKELW